MSWSGNGIINLLFVRKSKECSGVLLVPFFYIFLMFNNNCNINCKKSKWAANHFDIWTEMLMANGDIVGQTICLGSIGCYRKVKQCETQFCLVS